MGTRVRVRPVPWSSPDAYPSGGNPSLSHRWAKWHSRLMAPIESRTPDWRMGFGLQTARTGLRYRNPVIERTAISRVSKSFRGDLQPGKVAMPRGPRSEKRPADVIGAGRYLPWASPKFKLRHRIKELVENLPDLAVLVEPLLIVRRVVREQLGILHRRLLAIVRDDDVCRRLMTIPGVGPVVARDEGPRPAARSPCRRR